MYSEKTNCDCTLEFNKAKSVKPFDNQPSDIFLCIKKLKGARVYSTETTLDFLIIPKAVFCL